MSDKRTGKKAKQVKVVAPPVSEPAPQVRKGGPAAPTKRPR